MQKEEKMNEQKMISMEEYLRRRQKIREDEKRKEGKLFREEIRPAWMLAGLYV